MNFNMPFIVYYTVVNELNMAQGSKRCIFMFYCLKEINIYVHKRTGRNFI